jgi:hypothetical protein
LIFTKKYLRKLKTATIINTSLTNGENEVEDNTDDKMRRAEELIKSAKVLGDLDTAIKQAVRRVSADGGVTPPLILTALSRLLADAASAYGVPLENYMQQAKQAYGLAIALNSVEDGGADDWYV